jgi:sugar (pentulose or hexulose) kinase
VLAGIHESSANYVRYLAGGFGQFTLLSTGTWIISFDTSTPITQLREELDTASNTDIFGRHVATSRFFGGKEFETLAGSSANAKPSHAAVSNIVQRQVLALPSFTGSPGPMPGTAHRGRIVGEVPDGEARASLASLYCALMVSGQLDAVGSAHDIIVDGPFATNGVFLGLLAQLRQAQRVLASELRDGTTAGAACLALMGDEKLPRIALNPKPVAPAGIEGLSAYQTLWKEKAHENRR